MRQIHHVVNFEISWLEESTIHIAVDKHIRKLTATSKVYWEKV